MPNTPSEFGGHTNRLGMAPHPHKRTASERLSSVYRTGHEVGEIPDEDNEVHFNGLLPADVQRKRREQAGDLDKGQIWDEMLQAEKEEPEPIE